MKFAIRELDLLDCVSHPARGAWIEINTVYFDGMWFVSHPARGAWIEITGRRRINDVRTVAPRKGCVD